MKNASNDTRRRNEKNKKKRFDKKEQMSLNKNSKPHKTCKYAVCGAFLISAGFGFRIEIHPGTHQHQTSKTNCNTLITFFIGVGNKFTAVLTEDLEESVHGFNAIKVRTAHTCPRRYEPVEEFMFGVKQWLVDKKTENWLDEIADKLTFERWYFGHLHCYKVDGRAKILYKDIERFV